MKVHEVVHHHKTNTHKLAESSKWVLTGNKHKQIIACVCVFQHSDTLHVCVSRVLVLYMAQGSPWRLVTYNQDVLFLASWCVDGVGVC